MQEAMCERAALPSSRRSWASFSQAESFAPSFARQFAVTFSQPDWVQTLPRAVAPAALARSP
jgi:hypothetical protein